MEDKKIIELYWDRDESAIVETQKKYGNYCYSIAKGILRQREDAEEVTNDTYAGAWNCIPPHRPEILRTFLGKITRHLSLKRIREKMAQKRGCGEAELVLEELEECIPSASRVEQTMEEKELAEILNSFLEKLPVTQRRVFVCRYWYFDSVEDIAKHFGFGQSKVKMMLFYTLSLHDALPIYRKSVV